MFVALMSSSRVPTEVGAWRSRGIASPDTGRYLASLSLAMTVLLLLTPRLVAAYTPNDPLLSEQWYLSKIDAFKAWDVTLGDPSVVVAVIDSGVDIDHPDLAANIWTNSNEIVGDGIDNDNNGFPDDVHGWDFLSASADPRPKSKLDQPRAFGFHHGTAVAGIIAAVGDNGRGLTGIAPRVKIMPLRALDSAGKGTSSTVIKAIDYALANGASVINLSFVSTIEQPGGNRSSDAPFYRSIERARRAGVVVVAAAGNEATAERTEVVDLDERPQVPVCEDPGNPFQVLIGVAATDREDRRAEFSSFGRRCIDLSAPGSEFFVLTARRDATPGAVEENYGGYYKGTSLASPVVAAAAALLKSLDRMLAPEDIQTILEQTAVPIEVGTIYDGRVGKGRVDIAKALEHVKNRLAASSTRSLAQSVGASAVSQPAVATPAAAVPSAPRAPAESSRVVAPLKPKEFVVLALNGNNSVRLVRTLLDVKNAPLEEFLKLPGTVSSLDRLSSGDLVLSRVLPGRPTEIMVFTQDGVPVVSWRPFGKRYARAVSLAVGDVDGDAVEEIIVGAGAGGLPEVAVFSLAGKRKAQFFASARSFRGGVMLAVGDLLARVAEEIVAVEPSPGRTQIRVFDGRGKAVVQFLAGDASARFSGSVAVVEHPTVAEPVIAVASVKQKKGSVMLFDRTGKAVGTVVVFDSIDRAFLVDRNRHSSVVAVSARSNPSIVGLLSKSLERVRVIQFPKGTASIAL